MSDVARRVALLAVLIAAAACAREKSAPLPADPAPLSSLNLRMLDGNLFDPASVEGKVVVINFWSPG